MKKFTHSRINSFGHAFRGLLYVVRTQQNAWIHATVTVAVLVLGVWLWLPAHDWAILMLTIAVVWMAEALNTSIEAVVDLVSPTHHPLAKVGKDVGAAAVLIVAIVAIIVGLLILGPPFWEKISVLIATPIPKP